MTEGEKITRASGSNLAFAFVSLPKERRLDMSTFYGFCRVVDDIADDPGISLEERRRLLAQWRAALSGPVAGEHPLAPEFREVLEKYAIDRALPGELIVGMEMDLSGVRFPTLEDLRLYCYRAAGVVGLVSISIFGATGAEAREHALALGQALQLTNILRDVAEDYRNGERIYLPLEDMERTGYSEADLAAGCHDGRFLEIMNHLAGKAAADYVTARRLVTQENRRALLPGLIMADIYEAVLRRMRADQFHVFEKKYRLGKIEKGAKVIRRTLLYW